MRASGSLARTSGQRCSRHWARDWHGPNLDALYDGLVAGENRVRPPLAVEIAISTPLPEPLTAYLDRVRGVFADAASDTGLPIDFRFV